MSESWRGEHPSFLRLDEWALGGSGDSGDPTLASHVAACGRCAAHLARLEDRDRLPAELRARAEGAPPRRWLTWGAPLVLAGAAAVALALFFVVGQRESSPKESSGDVIAAKGGPTVGVYLKRAGEVTLWNGLSPVRPGDRIRLAVVSSGHTAVAVFSASPMPPPARFKLLVLYAGELQPIGATLLPKAWEVDAAAGPESLFVVTAQRPIESTSLASVIESLPALPSAPMLTASGLWIAPIVLPKETP